MIPLFTLLFRVRHFNRVVFPEPLFPIMALNPPSDREKETSESIFFYLQKSLSPLLQSLVQTFFGVKQQIYEKRSTNQSSDASRWYFRWWDYYFRKNISNSHKDNTANYGKRNKSSVISTNNCSDHVRNNQTDKADYTAARNNRTDHKRTNEQ